MQNAVQFALAVFNGSLFEIVGFVHVAREFMLNK